MVRVAGKAQATRYFGKSMTEPKQPPRAAKRVARRAVRIAESAENGARPLSKRWREPFFAKLAETSNIAAACEHAGVSRAAVYALRRKDMTFYDRWLEALAQGYDNLEMEVLHQLRMGEAKDGPKFYPLVAMRMLQTHREAVTMQKARKSNVDAASIRASIDRKIAEMRALVLAEKMIAARQSENGESDDGD